VEVLQLSQSYATLSSRTSKLESLPHLFCRLAELATTSDGIVVLEQGLNFGGGDLGQYGINSNTSANGFLKCIYRRRELMESPKKQVAKQSPSKNDLSTTPKPKITKDGADSSGESELAEDSERDEDKVDDPSKKVEYVALAPFKDLYRVTPLYNLLARYST